MKKNFFLALIFHFSFSIFNSYAQPGEWVWMNGDSVGNQPGVFGVQGIPSPLNSPPSFYEAVEWTDKQGNFWLYGGFSLTLDKFSDLWKFNPMTSEWTWMKGPGIPNQSPVFGTQGIPSPATSPGRDGWCGASFIDTSGNLWLFGGSTAGSANNNCLWKYDISINQWAWMKGTAGNQNGSYGTKGVPNITNNPAARFETNASWTDNQNNLWLFGGYRSGNMDDLWRYNIATNTWTWMHGTQAGGTNGVYGTKGVPSPLNYPSARHVYAKWNDGNNNLWLFGGNASTGVMNDLWRYNANTNEWTWMGGSSSGNGTGVTGTLCVPDSNNIPSARWENRMSYTDAQHNFWLYGGASNFSSDIYDDVWIYNPFTHEWTMVSGSTASNVPANYGFKGIPLPTNNPGARLGGNSFMDTLGNLWHFGGWKPGTIFCNDMWKFFPDPQCPQAAGVAPIIALQSSDTLFCEKQCIDFSDLSTNNPTSWQWYFNGASPDTSTQQNPTNICYNSYGSFNVTLVACNLFGCDSITYTNFIQEFQNPVDSIWGINDTLFSLPAYSYQWFEVTNGIIAGATNQFYVPTQLGSYFCVVSDSIGCIATSNTIVLTAVKSEIYNSQFAISPNPFENELNISVKYNQQSEIVLYDIVSRKIIQQEFTKSISLKTEQLAKGVYICEVRNKNVVIGKIKVVKD